MKKYLIAAVALFVLALDANAQCSCGGGNASATIASSEAAAKSGTQVATFKALQMHCGGCASKVKKALGGVYGVKSVDIDVPTQQVKVTYDAAETNTGDFADAFASIKYTAPKYFDDKDVAYATFKAPDMHCAMCSSKITKALKADSGYKDVAINTETKDIVVAYDKSKTTPEKLAADIKAAGYTPEEQK